MADEKKVLIDVEIKIDDAVKRIADIKSQITDLKDKQKALGVVTDENRAQYEATAIEIKQLTAIYQVEQKEILNAAKADKAKVGSMEQLKAQLAETTSKYNKLSEAERQGADGVAMQTKIKGISDELKNTEGEIGIFNRNVGDYEGAIVRALGTNSKFFTSLQGLASGTGGVTGALKTAGAGVKSFGMKMLELLANPVVATVVAIAAVFLVLYGVFKKMIDVIKGNEEQSNKLEKVMQPLRLIGDLITQTFEKLADVFLNVAGAISEGVTAVLSFLGVTNDLNESTADYIKLEQEKQALVKNTRALNESTAKGERDIAAYRAIVADKEKYTLTERLEANKKAKDIEKTLLTQKLSNAKEELRIQEALSARTKDSAEEQDKLSQAKIKLYNIEKEYNEGMRSLSKESSRLMKEEASDAKAAASERKAQADKHFDLLISQIEAQKKYDDKLLETQRTYYKDDFSATQQYAEKVFNSQQETEKKKLNTQLKYGKINQTQYKKELDLLAMNQLLFNQSQYNSLEAEYKRQQDLIKKSEEQEIKLVEDKWAKELEAYEKNAKEMYGSDTSKEYIEDVNNFALQAAKQQAEEIKAIKKTSIATIITDIETQLSEHYGNDLKAYTDNELEKTKIEVKQLQEKLNLLNIENEARLKAGKETISIAETEAQLRTAQAKAANLQLTNELANANLTSSAKLDLKRAEIAAELALYEGNTTKELELKAKLAAAERDYATERIDSFQNYASKVSELGGALNEFLSANDEQQTQDNEAANEAKKDALDKRLAAGLISQTEYDTQIAENEKTLDKQKAEIAKKQAIREKLLKAFDIGINTATGIMKAVAASPLTGGLPFSAIVATMGALQLATVLATPLPKASKGMLLKGSSHAQGGMVIEAEGGEAIINKRSTQMFAPILSAINEAGGGVAFTNTRYTDGGYAARRAVNNTITSDSIAEAVSKALEKLKIYTTIEDINKGQTNYTKIADRGNY